MLAADLNERQRAYLLAIFETDQEVEAEMRDLPYRPFQERPKASEWRWLEYEEPVPIIGEPGSALWRRIKKLDLVDQGTGSTFSALADRGLVDVQWHRVNVHGQGVPHLRMTTNGRKLARSWTGRPVYKAPPAGTLKEWHWRALAKAYAAGDEGIEGEYGIYGRIGERTWQRLLEYKRGALVEERGTLIDVVTGRVHRMHIAAAGRALYEREWARYRPVDCTNVC
jgi:hypothetical protein